MEIILQGIKVSIDSGTRAAEREAEKRLLKEGITPVCLSVSKRSVDARSRDNICYVCSVIADIGEASPSEELLKRISATAKKSDELVIERGEETLAKRPLVVGFGPAGMFAAMILAEQGLAPIVIERGECVSDRRRSVESFYKSGELSENSNIQFGAGGAGTFSDGKLVTRINDEKCAFVLKRLCELGAPSDILVNAKPHIGTDLLGNIIDNAEKRIRELGGEVLYNTKFEGYTRLSDGTFKVLTNNSDISAGVIVLAVGHSARDTYGVLERDGFIMSPKAFSAGVRIEHLREDINMAMYGKYADKLPAAEYAFSKRVGDRGVYTFCMCPGGEVVAAASEREGVVVNGMSAHARNKRNSNAAIAVSVLPSDFGNTVAGAIMFQRMLEKRAFLAGGGGYRAPASTVGDFMKGEKGTPFKRVKPSYMGGGRYSLSDLSSMMPGFMTEMLRLGISDFGKRLRGFDAPYAVLTGFETRTSAPLRIERGEDMCALSREGIYPCGEGAGYAGGITSAATDGIRCALSILAKYKGIKQTEMQR